MADTLLIVPKSINVDHGLLPEEARPKVRKFEDFLPPIIRFNQETILKLLRQIMIAA